MRKVVVYVHGKGGSPEEAKHYIPLFQDSEILGFPYHATTPWEAMEEFPSFFRKLKADYGSVTLIANSIGAYFSLLSLEDQSFEKVFLISPVVDMEALIRNMMLWSGVDEEKLEAEGTIGTNFGETLSWDYLSWVRKHPVSWSSKTYILYGGNDNLQTKETIRNFAEKTGSDLSIMENGEHWFHTPEEMETLDSWIRRKASDPAKTRKED